MKNKYHQKQKRAFTLVEMTIVIVILAIAAVLALPMFSSAASTRLEAAATMIAADLEYARTLAVSNQQRYTVIFDESNDKYEIRDSDNELVEDPMKPGSNFVINFSTESRLSGVTISSADFDSLQSISFDYLGSPYSGATLNTPLAADGVISLQASGSSATVTVCPVTGYITTQQ
jgi:prepilin-type N-terminal cleavage/methylation domain-containing protein